ncbi:MAG: polysaccharide biosynthesis/export family protein [Bacteroidetes bacterium]|nr:polysaccharide biosynthesis/export family protein [Bacteroidota bacterium]
MKKGIYLLLMITLIASCIPKRNYYYFSKKNAAVDNDSIFSSIQTQSIPVHLLSEGDEVEIQINPINIIQDNGNAGKSTNNVIIPSYKVSHLGFINLPILGNTYVKGKTLLSLQDSLLIAYRKFYTDPFVSVDLKSFKVVVLGEVRVPGTKIINYDNATILEALSLSGDLSEDAKRVNIKIIRKNLDNTLREIQVDLSSVSIFNSECYYLMSNDIIYVSQISAKRYLTRAQSIAISLTAINTIFIVLNNFIKL